MSDYGYLNARMRGMKSYLLKPDNFEKLLNAKNFSKLLALMQETPYKGKIQESLVRYSGLNAFEYALKQDFVYSCQRVLAVSQGKQHLLIKVLLARWDLYNIKAVLRGKHAELSAAEIVRNFFPVGQLDEVALEELANQHGVKAVVDLLATWNIDLATPLIDNLEDYLRDKNLPKLELALDKYYFASTLKQVKKLGQNYKLVMDVLKSQIDIVNIMTIIRLLHEGITVFNEEDRKLTKKEREKRKRKIENEIRKREKERLRLEKRKAKEEEKRKKEEEKALLTMGKLGKKMLEKKLPLIENKNEDKETEDESIIRSEIINIEDYFVDGGKEITSEKLDSLMRCATVRDALVILQETSFSEAIDKRMMFFENLADISVFERSLEEILIRRHCHVYRDYPVSIAIVISYLWLKYNEIINLRILGRCLDFGMPLDVIKGELVFAL